jgi:predicted N-acyltransferase
MQAKTGELDFRITRSIRDIPQQDWVRLFGENLVEGYGYQRSLEEAGLADFSFGYLCGEKENSLCAIFPFFIMDFSADMLLPPALRKLIFPLQKIFPRFLKIKVLFLGMLTAEEFYLGIAEKDDLGLILEAALRQLRAHCRKEKVCMATFHNLSEKNSSLINLIRKHGFVKMETLPTTQFEIKAASFEEYSRSLSKNMRKDLNKKLKSSAELAKLRTEERTDTSGILEDIFRLYINNFSDSDIHFEILTPAFFRDICRNMPQVARYFITYDADKIVAFNLCLIKGDTFIDKFIGFDYAVAHKYHLYFTTFCHNLEFCIKNNIRFYQPGTTDYYPKLRLGAKLIPLYDYTSTFNPLFDAGFRLIAPFIQPKNLDPSLKNLQ